MSSDPNREDPANTVTPPEGEAGIPSVTQPRTGRVSWKGIFAVAMLVLSLVAVTGASINRALSSPNDDESQAKRMGERPTAAAAQARKLDMTLPPAAMPSAPASAPTIPAIVPTPEDGMVEPIGVRRTGQGPTGAAGAQRVLPEDAPVVLVSSRPAGSAGPAVGAASPAAYTHPPEDGPQEGDPLEATRRNLEAYQRQLQGLLDTMTRTAAGDSAPSTEPTPTPMGMPSFGGLSASPGMPSPGSLFGGQLQGSATPRVAAAMLGNRSLTLSKGTSFNCALKTRVVSATSGFVGCQVQRNVYSDDGRVLLVERGSHMDGEYRITSVRPGTVRIPVLWTRIRTPNGVTVDIDSPGTGPLGESGIEGHVDKRWGERIGAAMLLSLIDDSVKLIIQNQASNSNADTIVLPSTTGNTSKLAEKVLDSTINIPPLIYQNQGGIVGVYVARDVDFSSVYELKASQR